ncbi:MAG TPA: phosphatase PAP2 family protein [Actinomycetota bacterium]|jgi:undecaprenyl-diphosphatase|nr:phosphatase PAP2 family protein [Actinomycetota bacterium]
MLARRGPLDGSSASPRAEALARRWRHLRVGAPSALYLLGWAVVIAAVGVVAGMLLAKVGAHTALGRADAGVDRWLAGHRAPDLDTITLVATEIGGTPVVATLAVLTVAGAALRWRRWREPALVGAAVLGEVLIFLAITTLVDRPRPPVPHLDAAPPTSSFPSGHTAAAIVLYGSWAVLAFEHARSALARGLLTALAIIAPVVVGLARLYRGMHFPTDVIAGALLGLVWLPLTVRAVRLGVLHQRLRAGAPGRARRAVFRHG